MSEDDMLSQDEIDALMNEKDDAEAETEEEPASEEKRVLTEEEKDILGEVGNIAMGSAATALYSLLDQEVNITTPEVKIIDFGELTQEYERPCVVVKVDYVEGLEGYNILIIDESDAKVIADLMMGGDGTNQDVELDEIHLSAVGEAMNQMMGSSSTAMSSIIDEVVNISPPEPDYIDLNDVIGQEEDYFDSDDTVVEVSFQLQIGDLIDSSFKQIIPLNFTQQLIDQLTENGGGLTAKNGTSSEGSMADEVREQMDASAEEPEEEAPAPDSGPTEEKETAAASASSESSPGQPAGSQGNVEKEEVGVQTAQFPSFDEGSGQPQPKNMELIKDVPLEVTVRLGKSQMTIREILDLGEGSIIELDKLAGEPVDLLVNGKLVAKGEVVVIDENFGFRVKDIIKPMDRINNI